MYKKDVKKRLSIEQITSEYLKRQKLESINFPIKLRRSTQKLCNVCNLSAEMYEEIFHLTESDFAQSIEQDSWLIFWG